MYLLMAFLGCLLTIYLQYFGYSAVLASSVTGLIASILFLNKKTPLAAPAFCGSFAGMTALNNIANPHNVNNFFISILLLALIVTFVYKLTLIINQSKKYSKYVFNGYGGRLGTIAFISVIIFLTFKSFNGIEIYKTAYLNDFLLPNNLIIILITSIGAYSTYCLSNKEICRKNTNSKIFVPSILSLIFCLFFSKYGIYSQAFYAGTFTGMSSQDNLSKKENLAAGIMTGLFFIVSETLFIGVGGKLGLTAFLAVLTTLLITDNLKNFSLLQAKINED